MEYSLLILTILFIIDTAYSQDNSCRVSGDILGYCENTSTLSETNRINFCAEYLPEKVCVPFETVGLNLTKYSKYGVLIISKQLMRQSKVWF